MSRRARQSNVPPALGPFDAGEKILEAAETAPGAWVVATTHGLRVLLPATPEGDAAGQGDAPTSATFPEGDTVREGDVPISPTAPTVFRGDWADVESAKVDAKAGHLLIEWNNGQAPLTIPVLGRHRRLVSVLHERVTASTVAGQTVAVEGGTVRVAIRRRPDGSVFSQVAAPAAVDLAAPAVLARVAAAERSLRDAAGLPA
jgi:hypothetical protein